MGHAIPSLLFTKDTVAIYIGSYGDLDKSIHFRIGRLEIYFKYNPLLWELGLCTHHNSKDVTITMQIIIILMGPVASLIIGIISSYITYISTNNSIMFISFMFALSSFLDFYYNIVPDHQVIKLHNGDEIYNDGHQLKLLLKYRKFPKDYDKSVEYYNNQEFEKSGILFEKIINAGSDQDFVYRLAISSYLCLKNYNKANEINKAFNKKYKKSLNSQDLLNNGLIGSYKGRLEQSIKDYTQSLQLDPNNTISLNNRGYAYNLSDRYEEAIIDFNKAIALDDQFAYAFNNRGLSKVKLGDFENGFIDIKKSLDLDNSNSYCYLNLGIYHFDLGNYHTALENFNLAYELDDQTYLIKEHIKETKEKLDM